MLGFLNVEKIKTIIASDISDDAVQLANENLSLLTKNGLAQRIQQLNHLRLLYNKNSHIEALDSANNLFGILTNATHEIEYETFRTDVFSSEPFNNQNFKADIIFTDVPYGKLVKWQNDMRRNGDYVNFLDQLLPIAKDKSIVAVCSDKSQKFQSEYFQRVEKQVVGKRLFQIFQRNPT